MVDTQGILCLSNYANQKNREADDVRIWVLLLGTTYMSSSFQIWPAIFSCCGYLVTSEDAEADKSSFVSWQPITELTESKRKEDSFAENQF